MKLFNVPVVDDGTLGTRHVQSLCDNGSFDKIDIMDQGSHSLHDCLNISKRSAKIPRIIGTEVELCEV